MNYSNSNTTRKMRRSRSELSTSNIGDLNNLEPTTSRAAIRQKNLLEGSTSQAARMLGNLESSINRDSPLLNDKITEEHVFNFLVSDLEEISNQQEKLQAEIHVAENSRAISRRRSTRSSWSSNQQTFSEDEYPDILRQKQYFVDNLSSNLQKSGPLGIPKFKVQGEQMLSEELKSEYQNIVQAITESKNELSKQAEEINGLKSQEDAFLMITMDEDPHGLNERVNQEKAMFQEARDDLNKVLEIVFPNENDRKELRGAVLILINAYVNNAGCEEDQYVELSHTTLSNKGIISLVQGQIIRRHPNHTQKYRLCLKE